MIATCDAIKLRASAARVKRMGRARNIFCSSRSISSSGCVQSCSNRHRSPNPRLDAVLRSIWRRLIRAISDEDVKESRCDSNVSPKLFLASWNQIANWLQQVDLVRALA